MSLRLDSIGNGYSALEPEADALDAHAELNGLKNVLRRKLSPFLLVAAGSALVGCGSNVDTGAGGSDATEVFKCEATGFGESELIIDFQATTVRDLSTYEPVKDTNPDPLRTDLGDMPLDDESAIYKCVYNLDENCKLITVYPAVGTRYHAVHFEANSDLMQWDTFGDLAGHTEELSSDLDHPIEPQDIILIHVTSDPAGTGWYRVGLGVDESCSP